MNTRSKAGGEKPTLQVYEDYPASPSVVAAIPSHIQADRAPAMTTVEEEITAPPRGAASPRAMSTRSHQSTASAIARIRQAEFEAEERLAAIQRKELQLEAMLVKKRLALDVATIREETDRESEVDDTDAGGRVDDWLHRARIAPRKRDLDYESSDMRAPAPYPIRGERPGRAEATGRPTADVPATNERRENTERRRNDFVMPESERERHRHLTPPRGTTQRPRSPTPTGSRGRGIERLAEALEKMTQRQAPPSRQIHELPIFSGAAGEWLPFKAAMRDSSYRYNFSPVENIARLRACLRGEARELVSALLFTATDPAVIMKTLDQCYGRPEVIIDRALEDIRRLPRPGMAASELNTFAVKLQNIVHVIDSVDERGYLQNPMLARQVTEKLSPHIRSRWCDYAEEYGSREEPEIVTLSHFLMREADRAVRFTYAPVTQTTANIGNRIAPVSKYTEQRRQTAPMKRSAKVYTATTEVTPKSACYCCGEKHDVPKCTKFASMSLDKKWEWAKEAGICFLCLNSKHRKFRCRAKKCGVDGCKYAHHALLHSSRERDSERTSEKEDSETTAAAHTRLSDREVLLKVCPVSIKGSNGKEINTFALLDEGSTITLIDEDIALEIEAQGPKRPLHIHGVTTSQKEPNSRRVKISIRGTNENESHAIEARTVQSLSLGGQSISGEHLRYTHLDPIRNKELRFDYAKPRILIGSDNWHLIVSRRLLTGKRNEPAASLTHLGWVIHGTVPRVIHAAQRETVLHMYTTTRGSSADEDLDKLVRTHFDIDALGVSTKKKPIAEEQRAQEIFDATAKHVDGRWHVGLPWRNDSDNMPPSYDMALRRLHTIEKKMDKSPEFKASYTAQVNNLLEKGYAVRCENDQSHPRTWYLPHFAVTNPNKPGKVRLVFDAAAPSGGVCLNDKLLDGPDLLRMLNGILFRFREKDVAVTADIREMFLQIKIRAEDQAAQRFLWRGDNRDEPPVKYTMQSMIFGARSSPFLAHSVRDRNAEENRETHPLAYESITKNHYMDDWVESFDNDELAARAIQEVREVHFKAGFKLAGWDSNHAHLLNNISEEDKARTPKELGSNVHPYGKTLGMLWLPNEDELAFNTALHRVPEEVKNGSRPPTKREALGAAMSIFDPLGLLSPYTITAKVILQGLWKQKIGWDEPLPTDEAADFQVWMDDLEDVSKIKLPRCYEREEVINRQLHVFCDASEQAYATAIYWRCLKRDGTINVVLAAGKAKVAPIKAQSIPRLELQAALVGARLAVEVQKEHRWKADSVVLWSDSRTVLQWIRSDANYTPYVAHRLGEIAELTKEDQWRWVPTEANVADDATRSGRGLKSDDRWFTGPPFLYEREDRWPCENASERERDDEIVAHISENETELIDIRKFSSYERLVRTMARVYVFVNKCRRKANDHMNMENIREAERYLINIAQRESFPSEMRRLKTGGGVERGSKLYLLDPKLNENNVICLNGRINAATVPQEMKEPPILDGGHPLTRLIIKQKHETYKHAGRETLVNILRERFWILRLRPVVRKIVRECIICAKRRGRPAVPVKGNLPSVRLTATSRPFTNTGVDCFGPMWVTVGRRREKRWGMLFTCMVTRAVHIELIPSLSTDSAIMALRRMAARRGWPQMYLSDNGTNFHGADVELKNAYEDWKTKLPDYALTKRTEWRFIDPGAPNQGGAWERLIKSVKAALEVTLHEKAPKDETLSTLLTEIEHTLNARPLTHVPVTPDDAEALTPNHFLLGTASALPYLGDHHEADYRTWKFSQELANAFWRRWVKEYLPLLNPRGDHRREHVNIKKGDVVVIADGQLPRNVWPKGIVENVHLGPDGIVRSTDVRTRGGIFRRPARRLIVLPVEKGYEALRRGEIVTDNVARQR